MSSKSIAMYRGNEIPLLTKLYRGQTNTNRCGLHSHVHEWSITMCFPLNIFTEVRSF